MKTLQKLFCSLVIIFNILILCGIYNQQMYHGGQSNTSQLGRKSTLVHSTKLPAIFKDGNLNTQQKNSSQYMIYICRKLCGGFADRLRGIFTVYMMAKRSNRIFRIVEEQLCGTTTFLKPSEVDWTIKQGELYGLPNITYQDIFHHNLTEYLTHDAVYVKTRFNPPVSNGKSYKSLFHELFVLRDDVKDELDTFLQNSVHNRTTICAHIRVGKNEHINDAVSNNLGNLSEIWRFFSSYDKEDNVFFIASDSIDILAASKQRFPQRMIDIPGKIIHVDKMKDDSECSGMKKVLLDFYMLSMCDVLLLTFSGLGRLASYLRDSTEGQFCFQNERIYPCPYYLIRRQRGEQFYRPLVYK